MKYISFAIVCCTGLFLSASVDQATAKNRLCAFRSGPSGPCTCVDEKLGPGVFKKVSRGFCRKARPIEKVADEEASGDQGDSGDDSQNTSAPEATEAAADSTDEADSAVVDNSKSESDIKTGGVEQPTYSARAISSRLIEVRSRGKLRCGINPNLLGFAMRAATGEFVGLDADFCRAVAAATLGDSEKIEFVPLEASERFDALVSGKIDLLSRNTTWTMGRDVDLGMDFAGVLYFDGQGFMTSDDRGLVSAQQLDGAKVCVETGTTSETNLAYYFKTHQINVEVETFPTRAEMVKAYQTGACDAYSGDRSSLYADRAGFPEPDNHAVLPEVISKEPLGPAVLQGDAGWTEIVRWTLAGLINAEEVGLTRETAASKDELSADVKRLVEGAGKSGEALGLSKTWLRDVVSSIGNYGEIFDANVGVDSPLGMERGINALWKRGGILYAPPMW